MPMILVYIYFTCFTLLNIVTGVICESVLLIARSGEIDDLKRVRDERITLRNTLQEMFEEADTDGSGTVSEEEFTAALKNPSIQEKMETLQISFYDAEDLFEIVDVDGSGRST